MKSSFFKKIILLCFLIQGVSFSAMASDPQKMRGEVNNNVAVATRIVKNAQQLVKTDRSEENLRAAIALYTDAGKIFEKAAYVYNSLLPDHATQEDVDNAQQAMQLCIQSIQDIQKYIAQQHAEEAS